MVLPSATLFPQVLLPLYIFEERYRKMLARALEGDRMFIVAMQRPGAKRETPSSIACIGLIRVCIENPDGTSHLILQGLSRVELGPVTRYKPVRTHMIRPIQTTGNDSLEIDALLAKVRDLVHERITLGMPPFTLPGKQNTKEGHSLFSAKEMIGYLNKLTDADQVADLVSHALLKEAASRQTILETVEVEPRLKHLIHFLVAEIRAHRKQKKPK